MRKGSFVLPVVLILLGALFLISNLYPGFQVFDLLGHYWPFLLIGWGVLRGGEVLYTYSRNQPLPVSGVTGGEWLLIVLLMIIGSGSVGFNRFRNQFSDGRITLRGLEMFGEPFDYPLSGAVKTEGKQRLVVENLRGNVRIVGGNVSEITVTGRNTIRAFSEEEAQKLHNQAQFELVEQGDQVIVRTNQERLSGDGRIASDLDITVPKNFAILCRGRRGDFDVSEVSGQVEINSENAGVRLHEIGNKILIDLKRSDIVRATNIKGDIEIKGRGDDLELENVGGQVTVLATYSGNIHFRNLANPVRYESSNSNFSAKKVPGFIRMTRGELTGNDITGPLEIHSRLKDIQLSNFSDTINIDVDRGDIELKPHNTPLSKMDVKTRNGDIALVFPEAARFQLDAETLRGEIDNSYGKSIQENQEKRGGTLKSTDSQGVAINARTDRGRVSIRKAGRDDQDWDTGKTLPPRPPAPPKAPSPVQ